MERMVGVFIVFGLSALISVPFSLTFLWSARRDYRNQKINRTEYDYWKVNAWPMFFVLSLVMGYIPLSVLTQDWLK